MKERPILFAAPMVRAILAGQKTQTRRVCKGQRELSNAYDFPLDRCPYGQPGDRLWVREAWRVCSESDGVKPRDMDAAYRVWFEADAPHQPGAGRLRPGMFMPRRLSRITLEVIGVRVERLHQISRGDATAEGCPFANMRDAESPVRWYEGLWRLINGPGSWDANPWVWVVEFERVSEPCA